MFQHFRLAAPPPHLQNHVPAPSTDSSSVQQFQTSNVNDTFPTTSLSVGPGATRTSRAPYGSGDDDTYTLVFPNLDAFMEWKEKEEETNVVEFVKGDTHGSKAVPPRFKEHTKLVCARHSRNGRKKYVKKHPERVRKVPSRKIEGIGCGASISYKTYFDTDEIRACYLQQHTHEIGAANLPFTRRGRKLAVQEQGRKGKKAAAAAAVAAALSAAGPSAVESDSEPSTSAHHAPPTQAIAMLAPLPGVGFASAQWPPPQPGAPGPGVSHDRWNNMATLFESIRAHARTYEYPLPSVAALETVLIRLYLESPVALNAQGAIATAAHAIQTPAPVDPNIQPDLEDADADADAASDSGDEE
ncbi:hypothetical protein MKEN_01290900 [Mycena kentingensis (nom. inval.)]|nr:hypothetical protein MKEN_01290900 [Mycena kentingensis (nom. inval.)]